MNANTFSAELARDFESYVAALIRSDDLSNDLVYFEEMVPFDDYFFKCAVTPDKETLLHRLIFYYIQEVDRYMRRKDVGLFEEFCQKSNIDYDGTYPYKYEDSDLYIAILKNAAAIIFNHIYVDRMLMKQFSQHIATQVANLKQSEHPASLRKDGVLKRPSYWPRFVPRWLMSRDKMRCALCKCSLDNAISTTDCYHIDHITPLNQGGTSDPTNLQLLCPECNLRKGALNSDTSDSIIKFK